MIKTIQDIRFALYEANATTEKMVIEALAAQYERFTLSLESYTDECFDLMSEILSVKALLIKSGIDVFIVKLSTEMYRLSDSQKNKLLQIICEHYYLYEDLEFCWLIGDLIARSYELPVAMRAFHDVFSVASNNGKQGVALGLDILAQKSGHEPQLVREIEEILAAV